MPFTTPTAGEHNARSTASIRSVIRPAVLGATLAAVLAGPGVASAASVAPELMTGNPECAALGAGWSTIVKVDPPNGGDYSGKPRPERRDQAAGAADAGRDAREDRLTPWTG